ncbi:MAG: TonB-dependent receptor [Pseudomonadales bacterium]
MKVDEIRATLARLLGVFAVSFAFAIAAPVSIAQQSDQADEQDEADDETTEEIVVTGSRLKRSTFSSVAPLQVITGQVSREIGSIDPGDILQQSTAAAGTQIDITFQGFVLDNGPGSSTVDLRGLGASRTLVLINGRRAAPVGVEGAPFAVDLNIIPSSLVSQYEILTDGASSVYGSDALAGVANVILRKDFDGFELEAYTRIPEYSNGVEHTLSAAWGRNFDRGFIGIAADYRQADPVARDDRPWSEGCESYYEETTDGEIRTEMVQYEFLYGMNRSPCTIGFGSQRVWDNNGLFGSIYWTEGESNLGIPNLSEGVMYDVILDTDGDGAVDLDFTDYFLTSELGETHLIPDQERISVMAYGEYTFAGEMNITPYFEALFNRRETYALSLGAALFEEAPADNPYNPCNPNGLNGVDCGVAYNNALNDPTYVQNFGLRYEATCAQFGFSLAQCTPALFGLLLPGTGAVGALPLEGQVSIRGDRNFVQSEVEQMRLVTGVRGDLPMLSFGQMDNWSFDVALVHSDATGTSLRQGVNEERLLYSLNTSVLDPVTGEVTCGTPDGGPCVPVNLFAPSLYANLAQNDFATQAERDFLFSDRTFNTDYVQTYITGIMTGDLFEMPFGEVSAAFGYEYRHDEIDSIPNDVARDGLLWGYFRDLGAIGEKDTKEWFAEVEMPLLANLPAFRELTLNLSTRHTEDEFYGGAWTYSSKLAWRPYDSLLIRGTVGTSYRAPNLRENFLDGQSGFRTLADPCVTPEDAVVVTPGGVSYDPDQDIRTQTVIDNCIADGVDPTNLGIIASGATTPNYSVEVLTGVGQADLREERSESWTAGFAWEQPFFSAFDMTIGATYYDVEIKDEIIELFSQFSINDCYNDPQGDSAFCSNISRDLAGNGLINQVDEAFLNRDSKTTRGVDVNIAFDWPTQMFGRAVDLSADFNFNRKLEFQDIFVDIVGGGVDIDDDLLEFGFSKWEGQGIFRADIGDYRLTWGTRYVGSVRIDPDLREDLSFGNAANSRGLTCFGPDNGDVDCRPVGAAGNYFRHDLSFYYYGDVWTIGAGARNVLNEEPPLVDGRAVFSAWNVPFGAGYDINGRQYFINVAAHFDNLGF